ncbi:hypothetical protein [Microbacterium sp. ZW T5_56]|uniref:hypothetical protein n=1 Tax=Microbacterium sp. ZW T5_56 TaxID=3378081 RepID=UPI0038533B01
MENIAPIIVIASSASAVAMATFTGVVAKKQNAAYRAGRDARRAIRIERAAQG